jgi:hypothetical protein
MKDKDPESVISGTAATDQTEAALADLLADMPPANLGAWICHTGKMLSAKDRGSLDMVMFHLAVNVALRKELLRRLNNGAKLSDFCEEESE